jgi:hypothetical protein
VFEDTLDLMLLRRQHLSWQKSGTTVPCSDTTACIRGT